MYPEWRQDGKEIFFVGPDNTLMAAEVSITGASVEVRQVRSLFSMPNFGLNAAYAVAANGQRFLHPVMPGQSSAIPLTLVENWTAALRK